MKISTTRTNLRPFTVEDAEQLYLLNLDKDVIRYTGDKPYNDVEECERFILSYDQYKTYGTGRLAVIEKITGEFLGWCGLKFSRDLNEYDIGFRFFKKYWGKGFATETAMACMDYGFEDLHLKIIYGRTMKGNISSIRVLEKIGMTFKEEIEFAEHPGLLYYIERKEV